MHSEKIHHMLVWDDFIGNAEAREMLGGIDRSTLVRWVQIGKIQPAHKLPGRNGAYLFHRADIEALRDTLRSPTGA